MSKLVWDAIDERIYETGVDHGVLYVKDGNSYGNGVVWNGLTTVTEKPSGGEANAIYADNIKYLNLMSAEEFGATVEAYTYPDEFMECDGSASIATGVYIEGQTRKSFGLCYRTKVGSEANEDLGYKIHLIYNAKAAPSEKSRSTVNDSPEAVQFSWDVSTVPVVVNAKDSNDKPYKPVAHLIIDSRKFNTTALQAKLAELEEKLYGRDAVEANPSANPPVAAVTALEPTLLTPDEIVTLMGEAG